MFTLRDYQPSDFSPLLALDKLCFPPGIAYVTQALQMFLKPKDRIVIVAEQAGRIAGFVIAQPQRDGVSAHIITLDVDPSMRRSGLGTELMQAVEQHLCATGCKTIFLEVAVDNLPAISFYKRLGYSILKTLPRYYLNSLDALLMARKLS